MKDTGLDRRTLMGLGAVAAAAWPLRARADEVVEPPDVIALWPGTPPGGAGVTLTPAIEETGSDPALPDRHLSQIGTPQMTVFRPAQPDGSALLILPGGGYLFEAYDAEGVVPANVFGAGGVTAFVLSYRLPSEGWKNPADVPLEDAQRAMRILRTRGVRDYGIDPARIGVLGFSAGGHLAASLATRFDAHVYDAVDDSDTANARPDFAALLYPVITMLPPFAHEASCEHLLGPNAPQDLREAYSAERAVDARTPPMFLCAATDDPDVPVDNSLAMYASLRAAKVPAEMHLFERGGHGFAIRAAAGLPAAAWPGLLQRWAYDRKFFRVLPG